MNHLSFIQLQEVAAGEATPEQELHAAHCASCRARIEELRRVDAALRSLPAERTTEEFADKVMRRLGVRSSSSIAWILFKNLAPAVALLLVSVIAVVSLKYFGAFEGSGLGQSATNLQSVSGWFASELSKGTASLSQMLEKYFPFAFGKSSYGLTAFFVFFLVVVAVVDKYLLMPMMRKRGM
jgi:hypothetical protein